MSKRFGRNQRRRAREIEELLIKTKEYGLQVTKRVMELEKENRAQAQRLVRFEGEVARMIATLQSTTQVDRPHINPRIARVSSSLKAFVPPPTVQYDLKLEQLHLLDGPEAVASLAITIGREIARALADQSRLSRR